MRKFLLLSALVVVFFALSFGTANAVWKIGGTGPFLNYPFYVEGTYDQVSFKSFLIVNNTQKTLIPATDVVAAIHYVTSDLDGVPGITLDDIGCLGAPVGSCPGSPASEVQSETQIRDFHLTHTQSMIVVPGVTDPGLGNTYVKVWAGPQFTVGWVELWTYTAGTTPQPVDCNGMIRGEGLTLDIANRSAWTYKAVAVVNDPTGSTSDVTGACFGGNTNDVWWNANWYATFVLPTGYNNLASLYNLDLWVKAPAGGNTSNNTVLILTNPNNRKLSSSSAMCRDCTNVALDVYTAAEDSDHRDFDLCEMRLISIRDDTAPTLASEVFFGWGQIQEIADNNPYDTQGAAALGCATGQWQYPVPGTTPTCLGPGGQGTGVQSVCGLIDPLTPANGCKACDLTVDGFLATAYTSWAGAAQGLTYWGNNLFNNCGDATNWNGFSPAVGPYNNCP